MKSCKQFNHRVLLIIFVDILSLIVAWYGALWMRFDFSINAIPRNYLTTLNHFILPVILLTLAVYYAFRLYRSVWTFVSIHELSRVVAAYAALIVVYGALVLLFHFDLPRSVYVMAYILSFLFAAGIRISYRFLRLACNRYGLKNKKMTNTMVIGAGRAGSLIIRDLNHSAKSTSRVVCLIDDNKTKYGKDIDGVPIVGGRYDIPAMAEKNKVDEIIFAIPTASGQDKRAILDICKKETTCSLKVVPGIYQLVNGEVSIDKVRPVEIEDLLGRDPIVVNNDEIFQYLQGKTVMVTGGGGSIGSELVRQIGRCHPQNLIVFDVYENCVYSLQQELKRTHPDLKPLFLIGSVRNRERLDDILKTGIPISSSTPRLINTCPSWKTAPTKPLKTTSSAPLTWPKPQGKTASKSLC